MEAEVIIPDISNLDEIIILLKQLWPDKTINPDNIKSIFIANSSSESYRYLAAKADGKIIGFISLSVKNSLWQEGKTARIDELIVHEDYRGKGTGTILLNEIIQTARALGCKNVELDSAHHREDAHRFYESRGFINRALLYSMDL